MHRVLAAALLLIFCMPWTLRSEYLPPPLLLSFNLASDWDIATLEQLQLEQQATYFVTPQVARAYAERIKKLATRNTIGLLYRAPSSPTNRFEVRQALAAGRQALAAVIGQEPVWLRSTPDKWHRQTLELAREAGFRYDSSEFGRQLVQDILPEFPIIAPPSGIWRPIALWKEEYRKHTITGRPFIVQVGMHTIDAYRQDVHALINFAKNHGGRCLTFDQYLRTLAADVPKYRGIYLDLSEGAVNPEQVAADVVHAGITDVFLMAQDVSGRKYYRISAASPGGAEPVFVTLAKRLRTAGVRVHAWIAVNRNERLAVNRPQLAMVDVHGKRSTKWISPSHPKNVELKLTVHELVVNNDLDGIHLDYLGYPNIDFDFSDQAIRAFEQAHGEKVSRSLPRSLFRTTYGDRWISWRSRQLQSMVLDAASTIKSFSTKKLILSGALDAAAVSDYRQMEASAQDLSLLANDLDLIVVKLDLPSLTGSLWGERLAITPRLLAGNRPLLLACPYSRSAVSKKISWSAELEAALPRIQGVAYRYEGNDPAASGGSEATVALSQGSTLPGLQEREETQPQQVAKQAAEAPPSVSGSVGGKATVVTGQGPVSSDTTVAEKALPPQGMKQNTDKVSDPPRAERGRAATVANQGASVPDSPVGEGGQPVQTVGTVGSTLAMVRYGLFAAGMVILLMVAAMRILKVRRKLRDSGEQVRMKEGKVSAMVLTEFISGFIYSIKQVVPAPDVGETGSKMAIILTSGTYFTMFYINNQQQASAPPDSQIQVTPADIPKLSAEAYIDTTKLIEGNEGYFKIEGLVGLIPDSVKTAIRTQIENSHIISQERQQQILREFK